MSHKTRRNAGSDNANEPVFLVLGKLRRAHGVYGEIPLEVYTRMMELLTPGKKILIGDQHMPYFIQDIRWKQDLLILKLEGINDRSEASAFTNSLVYINSKELPKLSGDDFYLHEIVGLDVFEEEGRLIGVLEEILETGANDVYIIRDDSGRETLIPAIDDMILEIDIANNKMVVAKMHWYGEDD
jgi:16S rRNA processing protein RimM